MNFLLKKEECNNKKIIKPDFNTKEGRELFALYLYSKLKQILEYDKLSETPVFKTINPGFIPKFNNRLINNPEKRFLIGISGESASGKTTICNTIELTTANKNIILLLSGILKADFFSLLQLKA